MRLAPKMGGTRGFNPDKINTYPMSIYGYKDGVSVLYNKGDGVSMCRSKKTV